MANRVLVLALAALAAAAGCATAPDGRPPRATGGNRGVQSSGLAAAEIHSLGMAVRTLSEEGLGNVVLASGTEQAYAMPVRGRQNETGRVLEQLTQGTGYLVQALPEYHFVYRPEYEPLTTLSLAGELPAKYDTTRVSVAFPGGMRLGVATEWLSRSAGLTVVTDNVICDGHIGEIALNDVPVTTVLEALLKSSTTVDHELEATDEYVLIRSRWNNSSPMPLLNGADLTPAQREFLDRTVDLVLPVPPRRPDTIDVQKRARPLAEAAPHMARALGVPVRVHPDCAEFPVNPAAFSDVRIETAMNLVVRQWVISGIGYELTEGGILFRPARP